MDPALVGAVTGFVVGVLGVALAAWTSHAERTLRHELADADRRSSESNRQHERQMASDARLFESRKDVYQELVAALFRWRTYLEGISPIPGVWGGEPVEGVLQGRLLSQDEYVEIWSRVAAVGSEEVVEGLEKCQKIATEYTRVTHENPKSNAEVRNWIDRMEALRKRVSPQFRSVEQLVREDLRGDVVTRGPTG